jgi:hypothetical protein
VNMQLRRTVLLLLSALVALALLAGPAAAATGEPPQNIAVPTISGHAQAGQSLTTDPGSWSGSDVAYAYQWQRCQINYDYTSMFPAGTTVAAYWPLGESGGPDAMDNYGANTGTYSASGVTYEAAPLVQEADLTYASRSQDTAIDLDGSGSVTIRPADAATNPTAAMSLTSWFEPAALPASGAAVGLAEKAGAYRLLLVGQSSGAVVRFQVFDGSSWHTATGSTAIAVGTAHEAIGTFDGASVKLYVDGVIDATASFAGSIASSANDLVLGAGFNGTLDDTSIFDAAYGASEAGESFTAGAGCHDIAGATGPSYSPSADDTDWTLRVAVTATNAVGSGTAISAQSAPVDPLPPANLAPPIIGGPAFFYSMAQGTLDVADLPFWSGNQGTPGTWQGMGGDTTTGGAQFSFQWQKCDASGSNCSDLSAANRSGYSVTDAQLYLLGSDVGSTFRVKITLTNRSGSATVTSAPSTVVQGDGSGNGIATNGGQAPPSISGSAQVGGTLTASSGTWIDDYVNPFQPSTWKLDHTLTFGYQWLRCDLASNGNRYNCGAISGATGQSYSPTTADSGHAIKVMVTAHDVNGPTNQISPGWVTIP